MRKIMTIIVTILLLITGCRTIQYVPIETGTKIEYRDTTIWKDSLIYVPIERIKEVVPQLDTLKMSTSMADATAYLDTTTRSLKGTLVNKEGVKEKIKWREKIVYRDSIVTKEVPVEVQVEKVVRKNPWYTPILILLSLVGVFYIITVAIKIYARLHGKIT